MLRFSVPAGYRRCVDSHDEQTTPGAYPFADHVARLVAAAPRFTSADLADFGILMGPALAELDAEAAAVPAMRQEAA
jgi:hypothetical protein